MRFLLGLIAGAAVVLAVAAGLSGEGDWRSRLMALAEQVQDLMATAAPASPDVELAAGPRAEPQALPEAEPQAIPETQPQAIPETQPQALPPPEPEPQAAGPVPDDAEPARNPIPRPPDPRPVDTPAPEADPPEPDPLPQDDVAAPRTPAPRPAAPSAPPESGAPGPGLQTVWVPFHSEMSASGFADRLSESLDHPFRVERRGPGSYQVVFGYDDEPERQSLLAEASRVTGLPL